MGARSRQSDRQSFTIDISGTTPIESEPKDTQDTSCVMILLTDYVVPITSFHQIGNKVHRLLVNVDIQTLCLKKKKPNMVYITIKIIGLRTQYFL